MVIVDELFTLEIQSCAFFNDFIAVRLKLISIQALREGMYTMGHYLTL